MNKGQKKSNEKKKPRGMLTHREAALRYPDRFQLSHDKDFIYGLMDTFDFDPNLRRELWDMLESVGHKLKTLTSDDFVELDLKHAKAALGKTKTAVDKVIDYLPLLEMHIEENTLVGRRSQPSNHVKEADEVGRGVQVLLNEYQDKNGTRSPFLASNLPFNGPVLLTQLVELSSMLELLSNVRSVRKSGPNKLRPFNHYVRQLLEFWHRKAGKPYPRTREHNPSAPRGEKTIIKSGGIGFVDFCVDCLDELGHSYQSTQLNTAVENAIADLEKPAEKNSKK